MVGVHWKHLCEECGDCCCIHRCAGSAQEKIVDLRAQLAEHARERAELHDGLASQTETLQRALAKMEEHACELHEAWAREAMLRASLGEVRGRFDAAIFEGLYDHFCADHDDAPGTLHDLVRRFLLPASDTAHNALAEADPAEPLEVIQRLIMVVDFHCDAEGDDRPTVAELRAAVDDCRRLFGEPRPADASSHEP